MSRTIDPGTHCRLGGLIIVSDNFPYASGVQSINDVL